MTYRAFARTMSQKHMDVTRREEPLVGRPFGTPAPDHYGHTN
jgi:hypothetical protein